MKHYVLRLLRPGLLEGILVFRYLIGHGDTNPSSDILFTLAFNYMVKSGAILVLKWQGRLDHERAYPLLFWRPWREWKRTAVELGFALGLGTAVWTLVIDPAKASSAAAVVLALLALTILIGLFGVGLWIWIRHGRSQPKED